MVKNFNKIIDLEFFDQNGISIKKITCPRHGQKPNITIAATLNGTDSLQSFNITVKNLDLDALMAYGRVKVTAGYVGSTYVAFLGEITSIYQDSPGPESSVIIQCTVGSYQTWVDKTITVDLPEGFLLRSAIQKISSMAGFKTPVIPPSITDYSPVVFTEQGNVQEVLHSLRKVFQDINITFQDDRIYVYKANSPSGKPTINLEYLSAPPQVIVGNNGVISYSTVTAPWNPSVKPGDSVTFSASYYKTRFGASRISKAQMSVVSLQLHFSTCGTVNQMVIEGATKGIG